MSNPFATAKSTPAPAPAATDVAAAPAAEASTAVGTVEKKARKKPNRQMTKEERKFVIDNYATKSTGEIAEELHLTRQQVYRSIYESRQKLTEKLTSLEAQPSTPEIEAQKAKINELLNKLPAKPFGGGQGGGGKKGSSVDSVLDELLA